MEELPPGRSLADSLMEGDAATAAADLVAYAETLATMHAWSLERTDEYEAARNRRGVGGDLRTWRAAAIERHRDRFLEFVARMGVRARAIDPELDEMDHALSSTSRVKLVGKMRRCR